MLLSKHNNKIIGNFQKRIMSDKREIVSLFLRNVANMALFECTWPQGALGRTGDTLKGVTLAVSDRVRAGDNLALWRVSGFNGAKIMFRDHRLLSTLA